MSKSASPFWCHIKFLYDEWQNGRIADNDYHARLINSFAQRIHKKRQNEPVFGRRVVPLVKKPADSPSKGFLKEFYRTYADEKYIKHEIGSLRLRPKIDRLERRIRGKKADFFIYRGDIVSTQSLRTNITCFGQVADIYIDEDSGYFASLTWLEPKLSNQRPEHFSPEKFKLYFKDEQLYPLEMLEFVEHRPKLKAYQKQYTAYRQIHRKYRKQLQRRIQKLKYQRERDREALRPEVAAGEPYRKPNPLWIERRERFCRNKSGFIVIKEVLKAGKQAKDAFL
uniref:Uncharacterized protein n=1 Tax=Panagrolaimus sp. ES5 TaxID=591445 RepID=A0AC34FYR7_9BILA